MSRKLISEIFGEYEPILSATKAKPTVRMYRIGLRKWWDRAHTEGKQYLDDLDMGDFISFAAYLSQTDLAASSKRVYLASVAFFLNWLVLMGYFSPTMQEMERFKSASHQWIEKTRSRSKIVTPEMIEKVLEAVESSDFKQPFYARNVAMLHFMFVTGCRVSEMLSLNFTNFDLPNHRVMVTGKGGKSRWLFFNQGVVELLKRYWGFIFPDAEMISVTEPAFQRHDSYETEGQPLSAQTARQIVQKCAIDAGFQRGAITPHSFRHAFAVKMLTETNNLALVQDLLGHSSPDTTRIYAKFTPERIQELYMEVWDAIPY